MLKTAFEHPYKMKSKFFVLRAGVVLHYLLEGHQHCNCAVVGTIDGE